MERQELETWNRGPVSENIQLLEQVRQQVDDAISRLEGFLAVNPGGPTVPRIHDDSSIAPDVQVCQPPT